MNYQSIYDQLISNAQSREIVSGVTYEKHHIIPKSLGGLDNKDNLVKLTLREHFIAHRLLVKIHTNHKQNHIKMIHALWWMCKTKTIQDQNIVNSYVYEHARKSFIQNCPMKDINLKQKIATKRQQGLYNYDYKRVSATLKSTLTNMSPAEMQTRIANSIGKADKTKRNQSIRKSKASKFRITQLDGSQVEFWSYDNVKEITGVSYPAILVRLRLHKGILFDGRKIECLHKFDKSNHKKIRSKLLLEKTDGSNIIFDPSEDVKAITGYSLCTIRARILRYNGLLSNGSRVSYLQKYNG